MHLIIIIVPIANKSVIILSAKGKPKDDPIILYNETIWETGCRMVEEKRRGFVV